jgi:NAD(P)-dependent dehydrogenase (short-subunit alcohol dehydrogenase family)
MTHAQTSIVSGFGARSTTSEVLAGIDLTGKIALVTGGYSGLGLGSVRALVAAGARVIVPALRPQVAAEALAGLANVEIAPLDLADLDSVRGFAEIFLATGRHIDIFIASAGIMACPETRVGPGWEAQLAVNHLGHYALVNRLWPALRGGARVVMVSSGAHRITGMRWSDPHFTSDYDRWQAYGQSKSANVLFTVHLDRQGREHGVRAFALNPGAIVTPLQRHFSREEQVSMGWLDENGVGIDPSFKTVEQGAATQVWAATSLQLANLGGLYCEDCDIAPLAEGDGPGVASHAIDAAEAERLWTYSSGLTGLDAFA